LELDPEQGTPKVYSISELTREIQGLLEGRFEFVWVEGEISNFSTPASGHYYMVLKDEKAQIRGVMFRPQARYLRFMPENGMHVLAQGRLGVYPPRGEYQLILDYLEPMGVGALALAFEQLKKKLAAQGVFDPKIKKPLPFLPQRVAVITSPTGAAIRDFLKIIGRRFANMEIIIVPVRVQGEGASADMVKALDLVNRKLDVDVIVLTRGGGSLEDLWAFNEEELALAIRRSNLPVVSAVGHEIDLTICDLAADFRAPTPSAAAELLVAEKETLIERLGEWKKRLVSALTQRLYRDSQELGHLHKRLKDPRKRLDETWMRLDEIQSRLIRSMDRVLREQDKRINAHRHTLMTFSPRKLIHDRAQRLEFCKTSLARAMTSHIKDMGYRLSALKDRMTDLSPLSILKRGYSITRRLPEYDVLRDASGVKAGDRVQVLLAEGELTCWVEDVKG
jgi:exodeoxyribonuclease VII large subunit